MRTTDEDLTTLYPIRSTREVRNTAKLSRALQYAGGEQVWVADYRVRFADGYGPMIMTARNKEQAQLFALRTRRWREIRAQAAENGGVA